MRVRAGSPRSAATVESMSVSPITDDRLEGGHSRRKSGCFGLDRSVRRGRARGAWPYSGKRRASCSHCASATRWTPPSSPTSRPTRVAWPVPSSAAAARSSATSLRRSSPGPPTSGSRSSTSRASPPTSGTAGLWPRIPSTRTWRGAPPRPASSWWKTARSCSARRRRAPRLPPRVRREKVATEGVTPDAKILERRAPRNEHEPPPRLEFSCSAAARVARAEHRRRPPARATEAPGEDAGGAGGQQHGRAPPGETRKTGRVQGGPLHPPERFATLDHPVPADVGDDRRQNDDADAPGEDEFQEHGERRHHERQDQDLPELDADVEGEQRDDAVPTGELQVLPERLREAEPVDEAEEARREPSASIRSEEHTSE